MFENEPATSTKGLMRDNQHPEIGLYAVRDTKAAAIESGVQTARATAVAIRMFSDLIADRTTMPGRHPEDFELVYLGQLTPDGIIAADTAMPVITGAAVRAAQEAQQANAR